MEQTFIQECVRAESWSSTCSDILRSQASQIWLQNGVKTIFQDEIPNRNLANPVPEKIARIIPDCYAAPLACQSALQYSCANSSAERGEAGNLCACFLPNIGPYQNCFCSGSVPNLDQGPCYSQICRITNLDLTLTDASGGNVNLSQTCGSQNMLVRNNCKVNGVRLFAEGSSIGNLGISQYCLTQSQNDTFSTNNNQDPTNKPEESLSPIWYLIALTILIIFLCLIFAIFYLIANNVPDEIIQVVNNYDKNT